MSNAFISYFIADIKGSVGFTQRDATSNLFLNVRGIEGLETGFHGFHIHENGDCSDPGSHFNPMMVFQNKLQLGKFAALDV